MRVFREIADLLLMKGRQSAGYVFHFTFSSYHRTLTMPCPLCPHCHPDVYLSSTNARLGIPYYVPLVPIALPTSRDLMAILPYPVAPPKNPQQKEQEKKKVRQLQKACRL